MVNMLACLRFMDTLVIIKRMISVENLENAYITLKDCYDAYVKNQSSPLIEFVSDSCVKRFEYTLETAWKLQKKILQKKYAKPEVELTINNIFRYMEGYGFIKSWESWRDYYKKRNDTAHEYSIVKSRRLLEIIPDFIVDVEFLIGKLKEIADEN